MSLNSPAGSSAGSDVAFGGGVAGGLEDEEFAVAGAAGADVEALVVVLVDEHVVRVGRAARVTPELELALLLFVFDGVEERGVVGGPDDRAHALDFSREGFAGFEILDVERVLAEAGGVYGVGEPASVVGDVGGADGEEGVALGELVAVEDDVLHRLRVRQGCHASGRRLRIACLPRCASSTTSRRRGRGLRRRSA